MPDTALTICEEAADELQVRGAGQTLASEDADTLLVTLNRLLDSWNAKRRAVYGDTFNTYTLQAALAPHTIGASGATWTVTQRPVTIEAAQLVEDGIGRPIIVRDAAWWAAQQSKELTGDPTDVFYDADWPLGRLFFWPVPDAAKTVELWTRVLLAQLTLATTFTMPPGYKDAVVLTLAEKSAVKFGKSVPVELAHLAREARALIFGNNDRVPSLVTADAGIPGGCGRPYDYRSGPFQ